MESIRGELKSLYQWRGEVAMIDTIKSINKPLQGSLKPVEPKVEEEDTANTVRLVFGTMEKDGTIRKPTPEEQELYDSYSE